MIIKQRINYNLNALLNEKIKLKKHEIITHEAEADCCRAGRR